MKIQHQQLIHAAQERRIGVTNVSGLMGCDAALLEKGEKKELLLRGTPTSLINARSQYFCDNKQLTKVVYETLNIPSPKSMIFRDIVDVNVFSFFEKGKNYVCKPVDGTNGVGVQMNLTDFKAIEIYWQKYKTLAGTFMLEEQIEGSDLRIQVVGGKIVAACTRIPAYIVGDGHQNIKQLIQQLQSRTKKNNPANDLVIDEDTETLLDEQSVYLTDVPSRGSKIQLKKVANMAQGAIALDLTDELHPGFQVWIDKLVTYLDTTYFGIDIIALDYRQAPENGAWVLEINARPEWLHHTFSDNKKHNMAAIVLDNLFS